MFVERAVPFINGITENLLKRLLRVFKKFELTKISYTKYVIYIKIYKT